MTCFCASAFGGSHWYCSHLWVSAFKTPILGVNRHFQAKHAKYSNCHVIKTTAAIPTKFCTVIKTSKYSSQMVPKCAPLQDGGQPPSWKKENCYISATVWPILTINWKGCAKKGFWHKNGGNCRGGHQLIRMGWQSIWTVGASACVIFILLQKIQKMAKKDMTFGYHAVGAPTCLRKQEGGNPTGTQHNPVLDRWPWYVWVGECFFWYRAIRPLSPKLQFAPSFGCPILRKLSASGGASPLTPDRGSVPEPHWGLCLRPPL